MSGDFIFYNTEDGQSRIELRAIGGTVWLTQAQIAELFQTTPQAITQLIGLIYEEAEADEAATCKQLLQVRQEGGREVTRNLKHYNLTIILAIGYRVRSARGTQFRRWANTVLKEYLVKGFVLNDRKLKEPEGGWDYFDELLERIREIRASEKRFYQKVRELFATAIDYDRSDKMARQFFQTIQNKMLWAVTGHTAAELITERAAPSKANMGLTSWKGDKVRKGDVETAKNYLADAEVRELDRLVSSFLDLASDRAERHQKTTMGQWIEFVDSFLKLAERPVLTHAGSISHDQMVKVVGQRYTTFDASRKEAERQAAEAAYEQDVEAELKQIEASVTRAKRAAKKRDSK